MQKKNGSVKETVENLKKSTGPCWGNFLEMIQQAGSFNRDMLDKVKLFAYPYIFLNHCRDLVEKKIWDLQQFYGNLATVVSYYFQMDEFFLDTLKVKTI